ncbi:alpha-1-antitrypsin-like [Heteronotia binoei]|uniref:alpha-1-antitrypsin-like n=1 Tax=Heteronotia binoei TaxID=13085 RepID=UPI00292DC003|nr:alpha-1-antitrypsin-like [Heteronotia binoei]
MSISWLYLLLACLCVIASCHHVPGHEGGHDGHEHPEDDQHPAESHQESGHLPCLKIAPSSAEFAFNFYRQIASQASGKNILFSPVSISTAFMLVTLGAKGTTLDQIVSGIGFNHSVISKKEINDGFHHLLQLLNRPDAHIDLSVGNALFSTDKFPVRQEIVDDARNLFQADIMPANFQNSEDAVNQINSYIEKKTHGKLVDFLKGLDQDTKMVLVNYIFMKGYWEKPFIPEFTWKRDFFVNNKTTVQVDMMERTGYYSSYHDKELGCEVVRIPYQGSASALFILPEEGKLNQVEQALGRETLLKWETSAEEWFLDLSLPKVSLRTSVDVKEIFQGLGVTEVFTDYANLSVFTEQCPLKISKAIHKAHLNIHENGTEAVATTFIEAVPQMDPPDLTFNKPFLLLIVEHLTRAILFMGRIVNPNEP